MFIEVGVIFLKAVGLSKDRPNNTALCLLPETAYCNYLL